MPEARARSGHPTAKPVELLIKMLRDFTDPGDVILDPFAGAGNHGVAALAIGRRYIGIESNAEHVATARKKLESAASGTLELAPRARAEALIPALRRVREVRTKTCAE
jgi:DNA modification methylase